MPLMDLHVQVKSNLEQTTFDIHNFNPTVRASDRSPVGPRYDYVVLSQGKYDAPTHVRLFINREEVLALYDQLTPIVEQWRADAQPVVVIPSAAAADAPEVALL
jgi:hypothetical protein